jgi:hypothetical protein
MEGCEYDDVGMIFLRRKLNGRRSRYGTKAGADPTQQSHGVALSAAEWHPIVCGHTRTCILRCVTVTPTNENKKYGGTLHGGGHENIDSLADSAFLRTFFGGEPLINNLFSLSEHADRKGLLRSYPQRTLFDRDRGRDIRTPNVYVGI